MDFHILQEEKKMPFHLFLSSGDDKKKLDKYSLVSGEITEQSAKLLYASLSLA